MAEQRLCDEERCRGWLTMVAACVGSCIHYSAFYMLGVMYVALLDHYRDGQVKTSFVGAVYSALLCFLAPVVSILMNRYSCRSVMVAGGLMLAIGSFVSAFVPSVDWLIVTFGILGGAFANTPMNVVIGYCFTSKTEVLMCIQSASKGLGMMLATPLGLHIFGQYGMNGAFIILSGIYLNISVLGLLMKPSPVEIDVKRRRKLPEMNTPVIDANSAFCVRLTAGLRAQFGNFLNAPFTLFLFGIISWNVMLAISLTHLPNYMKSKGDDNGHVLSVMICFGFSNIVGRLLSAVSQAHSKTIDPFKLNIVGLCIVGLTTLEFPYYNHLTSSEYVLVSLTGVLTGFPNGLMTPLAVRLLGLENLSVAFGFILCASGVGFLGGPTIASALYKSTGSYDSSFLLAGSINVAGGCCTLMSYILHKRRDKPTLHQHVETTIELIEKPHINEALRRE